ncbi:MAG: hypothetical protein LBT81_05310 [Helicobacteraceae bacterium]|jgi:hypothetical protein|nr:hypothetical protein [Helicobacteraceae bacterium]
MKTVWLILALVVCAFAHRLNLFITDENATIYIRSYFTKSAPCKECEVLVFDQSGREIANTKTDENGRTAIVLETHNVVVSVNGGMGHTARIEYKLTGELGEEIETPLWFSLAKGALSIFAIVLFFGTLRIVKRKKLPPKKDSGVTPDSEVPRSDRKESLNSSRP